MTAAETRNPRKNIPRAINGVYIRICIFYIMGVFVRVYVFALPHSFVDNATIHNRSLVWYAQATIAKFSLLRGQLPHPPGSSLSRLQVSKLYPALLTPVYWVCLYVFFVYDYLIESLTQASAWSAGSSDLYTSSRALFGLATTGQAPKIFRRVSQIISKNNVLNQVLMMGFFYLVDK